MNCRLVYLLCVFCGLATIAKGADSSRALLTHRFDELKQNTLEAVQGARSTDGGQAKDIGPDLVASLEVKPAQPIATVEQSPRLAVKLWGRVVDDKGREGQYVNLAEHKWSPGQALRIYLDTAVPVQLGIFQLASDGEPKQVSPDADSPKSFDPIMPGVEPWKSDVLTLDPDNRDEEICFVLVRVDARCLRVHGAPEELSPAMQVFIYNTPQADARAEANSQNVDEDLAPKKKQEKTSQELRGLAKIIYSKTKGIVIRKAYSLMKMQYASIGEATTSDQSEDVSLVQLGLGNIGFTKITFKKSVRP